MIAFTVITAACLFGAAGTARWWNAWVFLASGVSAVTAVQDATLLSELAGYR